MTSTEETAMTWVLSAFADEAGTTVEEQIAALERAEIDHIDLRGVDGVNICDLPLDHARRVRNQLDSAGIHVGMFGSPIGKIDIADDFEIDVRRLRHLGQLKDILGARAVRVFSYYNKANATDAEWRREAIARLRRLLEIAQDLGLVLYSENERGIFGDLVKDVRIIRDELRAADSDHFKMIFDFDNYNRSGEDAWEAWQQLGDATDAIHLKDSKEQPDGEWYHVPVGSGDGQVLRILEDLAKRDWAGMLSIEPHLTHSRAVLATGPGGQQNQQFASMSPADTFQVAAEAAIDLLKRVGKR